MKTMIISSKSIGIIFLLCATIVGLGCSKNAKPDDLTPDDKTDMTGEDMTADMDVPDAMVDQDLGTKDMMPDIDPNQLPNKCDATCAKLGLTLTYDGKTKAIDRVFFGLSSAQNTGSKQTELYIESYIGGTDGCPTQDSPTPNQTMILSKTQLPIDKTVKSDADGLTMKLIDFKQEFLGESLFVDATKISLTPVAANICLACLGTTQTQADQFIAYDVDIAFDKGTLKGRLYAKHCESMDAP